MWTACEPFNIMMRQIRRGLHSTSSCGGEHHEDLVTILNNKFPSSDNTINIYDFKLNFLNKEIYNENNA
jgi:hypothetical protein